jgi:putative spermidine/putrescine transport system substrate-binding protein
MKIYEKRLRRGSISGRRLFVLFTVFTLALLIAAACGEAATATPEAMPDEPTPTAMMEEEPDDAMPEPTAVMEDEEPDDAMPEPTATTEAMEETGMRLRSEWTVENPATREEIEAELAKYRGQSIVFSSWGGAYQSAQRQAYGEPFAEQFGIEVIDDSQPTVGRVRAMQESGNIAWHVFDTGGGSIHALANGGSLEELDFSVIDTRDFLEVLKAPYIGGGGITWSETWAYNTDIYPEGSQPQNMADIYDTEKFPGRRSWSQFPDAEIVFALLSENPDLINSAEGRASLSAPNEEQVDRAFELFEEYRDQPNIFWTTGSDCPQFLLSGEADLCTNWNGRIYDAAKEGAPLKICWECGHVLNTDGWGIIKGLKEQDPETFELTQLYMAWTSFPEINSRMAQFITYGPVNTKALAALSDPIYDEVRDELPSSPTNIPYAVINNEVHRAANLDAWRERYEAWKGTLN